MENHSGGDIAALGLENHSGGDIAALGLENHSGGDVAALGLVSSSPARSSGPLLGESGAGRETD